MRFAFAARFGAAFAVALSLVSAAQAALQITPPQLAPDEHGVIATEVKSSLTTASRWSVRVVPWDPSAPESNPVAMPVNAPGLPLQPSQPSQFSQPSGIEISPRFFSLAGSGRQVIRARVSDRSRYYRLLIEQIPDDSLSTQGVNFRFRFSLPIYRSSQDPLIPRGITIQ